MFVQQASELNRVVTYGWCDVVDVAQPYGLLDQADEDLFYQFWAQGSPLADITAPVGLDGLDLIEAMTRIANGCPAGSIVSGPELPPTEP